ncbi:hypothetical protein RM550_01700 [Streptomyces sp. DSM 41527]|uniref:Uncharacterized protein n=1 Tax=Streptomyces mooreae TaxID=3075523 RepID=A0ABU2SZM9_9ACTN|nr:hypothetical protein [Streptomyces sp. DSM 41527]MDT0454449.1 hypothetical protein [Streptomyces sp. DSM 41527]
MPVHHIRGDLVAQLGGQLHDDAAAVAIPRSPRLAPGPVRATTTVVTA